MFWNDEDLAELEGTPVVGLFIQMYYLVMHIVEVYLYIQKN